MISKALGKDKNPAPSKVGAEIAALRGSLPFKLSIFYLPYRLTSTSKLA